MAVLAVPVAAKADPSSSPSGNTVDVPTVVVQSKNGAAGGGLLQQTDDARATQGVSSKFIEEQSPTKNFVDLMQMLPSVNISPGDAIGIVGGNVSVRGFDPNDVGWVLDGAPITGIPDGSAGNYPQEVIVSEDIKSISLNPGSSALDAPTTRSSAGTAYIQMRDPSHQAGGAIDQTIGSDSLNREYVRLETGDIGNTGLRGFFSFAHTFADNWIGPGDNDMKHYDLKVVKDFQNNSQIAVEFTHQTEYLQNYLYPTKSQFDEYKATGEGADAFNYNTPYTGITDTTYARLGRVEPWNVYILAVPAKFVVNPDLVVQDTPYLYYSNGWITGGNDLTEGQTYSGTSPVSVDLNGDGAVTPGTTVLANTAYHYVNTQVGNTVKLNYTLGNQEFFAGWWFETNAQTQETPVVRVNQETGETYDMTSGASAYKLSNGATYYVSNQRWREQIDTLFLSDTISLFGAQVKITPGIKQMFASRQAYNYLPGTQSEATASDVIPQPQLTVSYQPNSTHQFYVNIATDTRLADTSDLVPGFSASSPIPYTAASNPKAEYSIKEELGYRYQGDILSADVELFNYNLNNRLISLNVLENGVEVAQTINAGRQATRGVDVQLATKPFFNVRPYISAEYLDSHIGTNMQAVDENGNVDYLPTDGKQQIESPRFKAALGLNYDNGSLYGNFDVRYVGSQYATFMNDEQIPSYVTDDLTVGYRFANVLRFKSLYIQLGLNNLTDAKFLSGVYSFTTNANAVKGVQGGTIAAAGSPTYFMEPSFSALLTVGATF